MPQPASCTDLAIWVLANALGLTLPTTINPHRCTSAVLKFVQVIPDSVNRPRPRAQNGRMPVLDAQLEGFGGFHSELAFIHIIQKNSAFTMVFSTLV